jgi:hypothetical protein
MLPNLAGLSLHEPRVSIDMPATTRSQSAQAADPVSHQQLREVSDVILEGLLKGQDTASVCRQLTVYCATRKNQCGPVVADSIFSIALEALGFDTNAKKQNLATAYTVAYQDHMQTDVRALALPAGNVTPRELFSAVCTWTRLWAEAAAAESTEMERYQGPDIGGNTQARYPWVQQMSTYSEYFMQQARFTIGCLALSNNLGIKPHARACGARELAFSWQMFDDVAPQNAVGPPDPPSRRFREDMVIIASCQYNALGGHAGRKQALRDEAGDVPLLRYYGDELTDNRIRAELTAWQAANPNWQGMLLALQTFQAGQMNYQALRALAKDLIFVPIFGDPVWREKVRHFQLGPMTKYASTRLWTSRPLPVEAASNMVAPEGTYQIYFAQLASTTRKYVLPPPPGTVLANSRPNGLLGRVRVHIRQLQTVAPDRRFIDLTSPAHASNMVDILEKPAPDTALMPITADRLFDIMNEVIIFVHVEYGDPRREEEEQRTRRITNKYGAYVRKRPPYSLTSPEYYRLPLPRVLALLFTDDDPRTITEGPFIEIVSSLLQGAESQNLLAPGDADGEDPERWYRDRFWDLFLKDNWYWYKKEIMKKAEASFAADDLAVLRAIKRRVRAALLTGSDPNVEDDDLEMSVSFPVDDGDFRRNISSIDSTLDDIEQDMGYPAGRLDKLRGDVVNIMQTECLLKNPLAGYAMALN